MYFSLEDPESSEHAPDLIKLSKYVFTRAIARSEIHDMSRMNLACAMGVDRLRMAWHAAQ
jgi:hypothetical protein